MLKNTENGGTIKIKLLAGESSLASNNYFTNKNIPLNKQLKELPLIIKIKL